MTFEDLPASMVNCWTYRGRPCVVRKVGRLNGRIRAAYVKFTDDTPEFIHIGLESDTFKNSVSTGPDTTPLPSNPLK